jgi:Rrf2 family cysteine metabolism transcriptional repressor
MTLLSRKTDYALLILSYLEGRPVGGCARTIAEHFGLSKGFVANILKELCQKGFVVSHRGVKGGYALQRPADEITLAELLESLEDGFRLANCNDHAPGTVHDGDECAILNTCPIKGPIGELHRRILETLRGVTLAEIFRPGLPAATFQPVLATLGLRDACAAAN